MEKTTKNLPRKAEFKKLWKGLQDRSAINYISESLIEQIACSVMKKTIVFLTIQTVWFIFEHFFITIIV